MPCDAVAVAGAQVAEEHLHQYLTPATLTTPLTTDLGARFPQPQIAAKPEAKRSSGASSPAA